MADKEDILKKWKELLDMVFKEEAKIMYERCIVDLDAEIRVLRPLAEVGRLFLALSPHEEVWFDMDGEMEPRLEHKELADACAKARETKDGG